MKKIFSLFAAVLFAGSMFATEVTFTKEDFAGQGTANTGSEVSATKDGVTFTYSKGYCADESLRCYAHGALSITASETIEKINFKTTGGKTGGLDAEVEVGATSYSVADLASQARFTEIKVTLAGGGDTPVEPKEEFYLTGSFRSWATTADANFKFAATATEGEYSLEAEFDAEITCKAIGLKEGADVKWYPDGMGNDLALEAGEYTIYLRPAGNAGEGWHEGVLKAEKKVSPVLPDPTNCAEAREAALSVSANNELYNDGKEYTIQGFVTSIAYAWKDGSMSFWMADEANGGNVLEAYKCAIEKEEDAVRVGDKVAVTGKLTKFNTTPEFAAGCTVEILERAAAPVNLGEKTIEEFLALKNAKDTCVLTGVVKNIQNTTYGNFDLEDETGTVYVYGLLTAAGEAKKFAEMGVEENDILTIKAVYGEHNGTPQAPNAVFVSVEKGEKPGPQTIELDVVYGEADLYATQGIWQINLYKDYDSETQTVTYPDLYIGVTPKSATTIAGIYSIEEEIAFVEVDVASEQTVTATEATDLEVVCLGDGVYSFYMEFVGDDGNTYVLDAEVPVLAYNGESEEGEEIELEDDPETGVESTKVADKAVKFIENATLLIERNGVRYNVMGQVVR